MRNKIIIVAIVILLLIVLGFAYYVKNVILVADKDGMVYEAQNSTNVEDTLLEGDEL
ncbi:MAG: hypothetical protein J6D06_01740 [Clostridia bacterium]|nr:hypothetical protein [Clostridia bacterium]